VQRRFAELFEHEVAVFLVPTGTAANALALAPLTPPWGAVLCHAEAHIATDECGAPEFFGGGIKLGWPAGGRRQDRARHAGRGARAWPTGGPHHVTPAVLSLSQATEAGTIYRPDEIHRLAEIAHGHGLAVHIDGARLGNALARMNASPAQATWQAGVDALSFGATKCGALAAEAVPFFDPARAAGMSERRKRGGHLLSKHRFIAAQMEAYLADGLWLKLAPQANAMADRLGAALAAAEFGPIWPIQANEVFVIMPPHVQQRVQSAGALFYPWTTKSLPEGHSAPDGALVRLVTSFVWTGRALQAGFDDLEGIGLAHLYPALERNVCVPGHHGYPRASDLILGQALKGRLGHQITDATARPFSSIQLADVGGYFFDSWHYGSVNAVFSRS
jgi:threonine aldolase